MFHVHSGVVPMSSVQERGGSISSVLEGLSQCIMGNGPHVTLSPLPNEKTDACECIIFPQ